jgi:hypothetical protein
MSKTEYKNTLKISKQRRFDINIFRSKEIFVFLFNLPIMVTYKQKEFSKKHYRDKILFRFHFAITIFYINLNINWLYLRLRVNKNI